MKNRVKSVISYVTPSLIVMVIGLIILGVQNIWPFGNETIDYFDMGQQVAAQYTQIWDEIHGAKSAVYDYYAGLGRGLCGGTFFSVFNLLYFCVPRNMILESFSIMFIVKTMLMALSMRIVLKNSVADCPEYFAIVLSAGYGLCGFVLMQYSIFYWLDIAIIAPFVIVNAQEILKEGRIWGFVISLSLILAIDFYIPAMILIFVFLASGAYVVSHRNEKCYLLRLGIGVAVSLLITSWSWFPKAIQASGSNRFSGEATGGLFNQYMSIIGHVLPDYSSRWWVLLGISFAAAICFIGIIRDIISKNYRRFIYVCMVMIITMAEIVFENVQRLWHFGSYVNYPMRNGFIVYIVFALTAAVYAREFVIKETDILTAEKKTKMIKVFRRGVLAGYEEETKTGLNVYVGMTLMIALCLGSFGVFWYLSNPGMSIYTIFRVSMLAVIATFLIYVILLLVKQGRFIKLSIFIFAAELIFYGVLLIGKPTYITGYAEEPEQESNYISISYQLQDSLNIASSKLDRIKNPDTSLNVNYGEIMRRATLSGWAQGTTKDELDAAVSLGYPIQFNRTLDTGGTVFSDALLHVTQVVSCTEQSETLYEKVSDVNVYADRTYEKIANYGLYNSRYCLPFGTILEYNPYENLNGCGIVDYTNELYRAILQERCDAENMAGSTDVAIDSQSDTIADRIEITTEEEQIVCIEGNKALYITGNCANLEYANCTISVNGEYVNIPTIQDMDNIKYPAHFNSNAIFAGCYDDEEVCINVSIDRDLWDGNYNFEAFTIDLDKLQNLCRYYTTRGDMSFGASGRRLYARVNGNAGQYLMLPIAYNADYSFVVNGNVSRAEKVNGLMIAIPLVAGENVIEMSYFPRTMRMGIIAAMVTVMVILIICGVMIVLKKYRTAKYADVAVNIIETEIRAANYVQIAYSVVWSMAIVLMYVIPIIYSFIYYLKLML